MKNHETLAGLLWFSIRHPLQALKGNTVVQSAAVCAINFWALSLAVLGQFYVMLSLLLSFLLVLQAWRVSRGSASRLSAIAIGVFLVVLNYLGLVFAILAQFWVFFSTALATWQFILLCKTQPPELLQSQRVDVVQAAPTGMPQADLIYVAQLAPPRSSAKSPLSN